MRARIFGCLALALAAGALTITPAPAGLQGVVVTQGFKYTPGDVQSGEPTLLVVAQGSSLLLVNAEVNFQSHSMTSMDYFPNTSTPLFDSEVVAALRTKDVSGVAQLSPGRYLFTCRITGHDMFGYLNVVALPGG